MADKLFYRTQVGITAGTPAILTHGLSANGVAVAPDSVTVIQRGAKIAGVTANAIVLSQGTDAVAIDVLAGGPTVDVVCMYWHSIQRAT